MNLSKRKAKFFNAEHDDYTRGIDIKSKFNLVHIYLHKSVFNNKKDFI